MPYYNDKSYIPVDSNCREKGNERELIKDFGKVYCSYPKYSGSENKCREKSDGRKEAFKSAGKGHCFYLQYPDSEDDCKEKEEENETGKEADDGCRFYPKYPEYPGFEGKYKEKEDGKKPGRDADKGPKHSELKLSLECGCSPQDAIFEDNDCDHEKHDKAFVLDTVLVDTACLCKPLVKIEFSSLVFFQAKAKECYEKEIKVELLFELVRSCKGEKEVLQSWKYLNGFELCGAEKLELEISEPFTVTFCHKACSGCCEYKMIVKAGELKGEFAALKVLKPDLSAIAQGISAIDLKPGFHEKFPGDFPVK